MADINENLEQNIKLTFDTNANQINQEVETLNTSIEGTTQATAESNQEIKKNADGYKNLKTQIREANNELQKAIQLHGETSQEAIRAAQAVAELRDQMEFAADLTANFNPDQKFKSLGAAANISATAINFAGGAIGAFAGDSEDATAVLQKMQTAMAFADGLRGLSDLGDQFAILKSTILAATAVREVDTAAEKKNIIQKGLSATVTGVLTAAQWAYNAALAANPVVAIALAVAALTAGIWLLVSAMAASEAAEQKQIKTAKENEKAQKKLTEARKESLTVMERNNQLQEDLSKASGKSAKEINKLANAHINEASRLSQKNAEIAKTNFLRERSILLDLKANDASEEALKAQKASMLNAYEELQDYNKKTTELKAKRIELNNQFLVDETQKETDARKKANDDALKAQQDANAKAIEEEKKKNEALKQERIKAEEEKKAFEKSVRDAETETLTNRYQEDRDNLERQNQEIEALEAQNDKVQEDKLAKEKEIAEARKAQKQAENDSLNALGNSALTAAKDLFGKNKAVQKGIIAADGAVALGKLAVNTVEAVGKDNAASPLTFGMPWSAVHIATGALGAASIITNTSKALQAVGGGSAGTAPAMPTSPTSGGGTRTQATATPQVSFQASNENQIASSIARNAQDQTPIKAYVVSSEVSTAQSLDRRKVEANSF
jgi:hypothetical protein